MSTPILDAAIRAGCVTVGARVGCMYPACNDRVFTYASVKAIEAALRSACPRDPPPEWIAAMKAALRHRLPAWIDDADMRAQWRAQPLWVELWSETHG